MTELDQAPVNWKALAADSRLEARGGRRFKGDEAAYEAWLAGNPGGFVVAVIGRDPMVHTSNCYHIQPDGELKYTANIKVCSDNENDLIEWARALYGEVAHCQHCR